MKAFWKATAAAAAMAGAMMFGSSAAQARVDFGISFNVPGAVGLDNDSGGYCDEWGCPDEYWDYPVFYGPVYYGGRWFNGPAYYRDYGGERWFWVHGGWRRDEWRGARPNWWRNNYRYGPSLGYEFYSSHGFRHGHDHYWRGNDWRPGRDWDHHHDGDHHDHDGDHHDHDSHDHGGHDHDSHDHGGHDHDSHDHGGHDHDSHDHDHDSGGDHHDHSGSGSGSGDDHHHHH
ncbi:MAG TPA: hypothetical protein VGF56_03575 [Rhizomicrobium sp.]|jgi:hypothetical protein